MRRKKVCFVGYGSTEYSRKSEESRLGYYADAIRAALNQTGLKKKEINGFSITTQASPDYGAARSGAVGLRTRLGIECRLRRRGRRHARAAGRRMPSNAAIWTWPSWSAAIPSIGASPTQRQLEYQRGNFVDVYGLWRAEFLNGADSTIAHGKLRHDPRTGRQDRHGAAL